MTASFSNGDPQVVLNDVGKDNWSGTWAPLNATVQRVTIQINAKGEDSESDTATIAASLQSGGIAPVTFATANFASGVVTPIAPGEMISIYGQQLADAPGQPNTFPLPTEINGTQISIGGRKLPLHLVGSNQITAQVPFELPANSTQQILVQRGTALSVPQNLVVTPAQPAVYTHDQTSTGLGLIVNSKGLVTPANRPVVGELLTVYCNGLGAVSPPVPSGSPAPVDGPLSAPVNRVSVTIGDKDAVLTSAGLVPGFPDLYQVSVEVPDNIDSTDDTVGVTISVAGFTSRAVKMPKPGKRGGTSGSPPPKY